jgi:hypothetical protein
LNHICYIYSESFMMTICRRNAGKHEELSKTN